MEMGRVRGGGGRGMAWHGMAWHGIAWSWMDRDGWLEGLVSPGRIGAGMFGMYVCSSVCTGRRRKYRKGWQRHVVVGLWEGMASFVDGNGMGAGSEGPTPVYFLICFLCYCVYIPFLSCVSTEDRYLQILKTPYSQFELFRWMLFDVHALLLI